jgi:hypothetical protein
MRRLDQLDPKRALGQIIPPLRMEPDCSRGNCPRLCGFSRPFATITFLPRFRGGGKCCRISLHPGLIHAAQIKGGGALIDATVTFHAAPTRATACRRSGRGRAYGRARLPALRRGTCGSERTPPLSFSPHFLGPGVIGCYPHLACPFSPAGCPAVPVVVPDGRIRRSRPSAECKSARGNRTRPVFRCASRTRPLGGRDIRS